MITLEENASRLFRSVPLRGFNELSLTVFKWRLKTWSLSIYISVNNHNHKKYFSFPRTSSLQIACFLVLPWHPAPKYHTCKLAGPNFVVVLSCDIIFKQQCGVSDSPRHPDEIWRMSEFFCIFYLVWHLLQHVPWRSFCRHEQPWIWTMINWARKSPD